MRVLWILVMLFCIVWWFFSYKLYKENICKISFDKKKQITTADDYCINFYFWKIADYKLDLKDKKLEKRIKLRLLYEEKLYNWVWYENVK